MSITVIGLGSGDEQQLTLGALQRLRAANELYLRTEQHPVVSFLRAEGMSWHSFDALYEQHAQFEQVYADIIEQLLAAGSRTEIVYAVPGHPFVAERTVQLLRERCASLNIQLTIYGGESFLDQAFLHFGFDPFEGFQCVDATALDQVSWNPNIHYVIGQVYHQLVAADVKLALMQMYPDDYPVFVGHSLGVKEAQLVERVPLYELDHIKHYGNLSLVWVPKTTDERLLNRGFDRLRQLVAILRSPEGCPWDREQTHQSIRKNLIEETCEVLDTIDDETPIEMKEELGDLLLQIMLHAQMEDELGEFSVYDVIQELNEKLIRRHPHVFGNALASDAEQALQNWQQMKAEEKKRRGIDAAQQSVLAGVPRSLTSLLRALKLQKKAATVGFDWPAYADVWNKCQEELREFEQAVQSGEAAAMTNEFGDILFSLVNAARFLRIDPEEALAHTNRKFVQRFQFIERELQAREVSFAEMTLDELDEIWQMAKQQEFSRE